MKRKAFTLVEVMTVITIMGIIGSLAIHNVIRARDRAKRKKCEADLELLASAMRQFIWDTQKLPVRLTDMGKINNRSMNLANSLMQTTTNGWGVEITNLAWGTAGLLRSTNYEGLGQGVWRGPYIKEIPLDPWGQKYCWDPDYYLSGASGTEVGQKGASSGYQWNDVAAVIHSFGPNKRGVNIYDGDNIYVRISDVYQSGSNGVNVRFR